MSYSQILRRINRLIKSNVRDVLESLTKDERELFEFDQELRRAKQQDSGARERAAKNEQSTQGGQGSSKQQSQKEKKHEPNAQGKRKPGEKDDGFYLAVLGLQPGASSEEIKRAYKKLMSKYHPDRVATLSEDLQKKASEKAQTINEAYQILSRRQNFR